MATKLIFPGVHVIPLGPVNTFLVADGSGYTLIDTGYGSSVLDMLDAFDEMRVRPETITNIVLTHCHPDHAGGAAELQRLCGATVWVHGQDATVVRGERPMGPAIPAPGLLNQILYRAVILRGPSTIQPTQDVQLLDDGMLLPISGGLRVIHTPGHSAGHVALLLERDGGLLFAGDTCSNLPNLRLSIVYEDLALGQRSLARLATIPAQTICFGHGQAISGPATQKFARRWAVDR
jgi:glyoxylase-like metal-dependent hydrolase (beta-lactamase superfamily II)